MQHPYKKYEDSQLWQLVDSMIAELQENQDLEITTAREYVVGAMCKRLDEVYQLMEAPPIRD